MHAPIKLISNVYEYKKECYRKNKQTKQISLSNKNLERKITIRTCTMHRLKKIKKQQKTLNNTFQQTHENARKTTKSPINYENVQTKYMYLGDKVK